jgi:predicted Rossmann-fold nucleotide-binding protein
VQSANAVIAIDGDYGTLSEIAIALKSGIPVVGLNTWAIVIDGKEDGSIIRTSDAKQAVRIALKSIHKLGRTISL